jgi:hypothetical protein
LQSFHFGTPVARPVIEWAGSLLSVFTALNVAKQSDPLAYVLKHHADKFEVFHISFIFLEFHSSFHYIFN